MNVIIRKATEKDIRDVAIIKINGWQTAYRGIIDDDFLDSMNLDVEIEKRKNMQNDDFIIAEINNKVVGFCIFRDYIKNEVNNSDADCELSSIYISTEFKRNGIGSQLMKYVMNDLKNRNKKKLILGCLKENYPSRAFYENLGGKILKYTKSKFGDKEYDLVLYSYDI